jgi:hypothetical protein
MVTEGTKYPHLDGAFAKAPIAMCHFDLIGPNLPSEAHTAHSGVFGTRAIYKSDFVALRALCGELFFPS